MKTVEVLEQMILETADLGLSQDEVAALTEAIAWEKVGEWLKEKDAVFYSDENYGGFTIRNYDSRLKINAASITELAAKLEKIK